MAFFELQKGSCKANNAQKEKWHLARKRSQAAKREWDREAAKAAALPTCECQCVACGQKFKSRKCASKHKCPNSKVVCSTESRPKGKLAVLPTVTPSTLDMPMAPPPAPPVPPHIHALPEVTGAFSDMAVSVSEETYVGMVVRTNRPPAPSHIASMRAHNHKPPLDSQR